MFLTFVGFCLLKRGEFPFSSFPPCPSVCLCFLPPPSHMQGEEGEGGGGGRGKEEEEEDDNGEKMRKMILSSLPLLSFLFFSSSLSLLLARRGGEKLKKGNYSAEMRLRDMVGAPFSRLSRGATQRQEKKRIVGFCVCGKLNVRTGSECNAHFSSFETERRRRSLLVLPAVGPSLYAGGPPDLAAHQHRTLFVLLRE